MVGVTTATGIAAANNQLALDLYKNLIVPKNTNENAFISPFSILAALSMVNVGAQGATRDEILTTTKLKGVSGGNLAQIDAAFKELYGKLKVKTTVDSSKKTASTDHEEPSWEPQPAYLALANRVYLQKDLQIKPKFSSTLKDFYNSTFGTVDFVKDAQGATREINGWVESVTNGKIKNLFDKFEPSDRMALASAIYFKAQWEKRFYSENLKKDFFAAGGQTVNVDFMDMSDGGSLYAEFPDIDATGLLKQYNPYSDFHMIIVLPNKKDGLVSLEKKLSEKLFDASQYKEAVVHVTMPKFKFEDEYNLVESLKKMGIQKAFSNDADFSGITQPTEVPLKVGDAVHKSFIAVDEKGTEAAAATGIRTVKTSAMVGGPPKRRVEFNADHPFVFAIQHRETGALLFLGRVENPVSKPSSL